MKIQKIAVEIEKIAPLELAQEWDNVGLLMGSRGDEVDKVLLTVDITPEVVAEAKRLGTDLIISYHPVIWEGLKKISPDSVDASGGIVYHLIRNNISVFSIHTALDTAEGGVNDELADAVGLREGRPLGDYVEKAAERNYKLVVFIPADSVNKVAEEIFKSGAGGIGNYSKCSFLTEGTGSFLPGEGSRPAIGKKGKVEKVKEVRFETIVPAGRVSECIEAMRKAHPYERPAFDCYRLYNPAEKHGLGRIGELEQPLEVSQIIEKIKGLTGAKAVGIVGKEERLVKTAAVCAGSCGRIINRVIAEGADLYVTGELKHHYALSARTAGVTCLCLSHSVSERFILGKLAKMLKKNLSQLTIEISKKDRDPFVWKQI